jgi:glutaredoxin
MRVVLPLFMSNELTLYSRTMCSWCIDAKDFLQSRGYKFTEIDVGRNRAAYEEMKEISEQSYVPTLVAGEEVLANFDVEQLEKWDAAYRDSILQRYLQLSRQAIGGGAGWWRRLRTRAEASGRYRSRNGWRTSRRRSPRGWPSPHARIAERA